LLAIGLAAIVYRAVVFLAWLIVCEEVVTCFR